MIPTPRARRFRTARALSVATATASGLLGTVTPMAVAAPTASAPTASAPAAVPAADCASPVFTRQFFPNTTFSGKPKKTDCDKVIDENWGTGAPVSGLPKDGYGVRWTLTRDFGSGGPFTLNAAAQDGIRVYVDGVRQINLWKDVSTTQKKTRDITVPKGKHKLRIDFVNWTGRANVKFGYVPRTSKSVDKTAPLTPTGVKAVLDNTTAEAKVTWQANKEMDLAGYRVYRRLEGSTKYTHVRTTTGTSYAGVPPEAGKTYYYEVRAYDKAGNVSAGSVNKPVTTIKATTPEGLAARGEDAGIVLTWKAVPGAVRYDVVRTNGQGSVTKSTTTAGFTDATAARSQNWTYRVAAVDGAARRSEYAVAVTAQRPVAAPREVTASAAVADRTVLTWKVNPATDGVYYDFHVYRSTRLPVDTAKSEPIRCATSWTTLADKQRQYTCTDLWPAEKTTYHYVIKGYDSRGVESLPSATVSVTTRESERDLTPPAQVKGLTATATEYGVVLRWTPNTESDLKRYEVHTGDVWTDEEDGTRVCADYGTAAYLGTDETTWTHETRPDGEEKCYFIDAVDTAGNSSYRWTREADIVAVTKLDLRPSTETPEGSPVRGLDVVRSTGGDTVNLSWYETDGAAGYLVQRWDRAAGTFRTLTDRPVTATDYVDRTAAPGTTHYYRVSAVYPDGTESVPAEDWVIVPPAK
ncbi:PA14 domain-containing protein [Streptomyces sp. NPDC093109]|uniref:fibronectin type III domain-containing protein n=1 Tax=Streptomyces sp. NPDC093109 TaxID=3154977 RepID=UPI00344E8C57